MKAKNCIRIPTIFPEGSTHVINQLPVPSRVVLPLSFSLGNVKPLVQAGDMVKAGQSVADDENRIVPPVRASISGTVSAIKPWLNELGQEVLSMVIDSDGDESVQRLFEGNGPDDAQEILNVISEAGIREVDPGNLPLSVRIGQPAFTPSFLFPFAPDLNRPIDFLIINGMDHQPGVTLRSAIIMAMGKDLVNCIPILNKISAPAKTVFAIEKGQPIPDNFEQDLESVGVEVLRCPSGYPNGVNRNLVQLVTGKTMIQSSGDSRSVGAAILDVCTALRILKAVKDGYPSVETLIHVSAPAGQSDSYVSVREGILLEELISLLPSAPSDMAKTIVGGPFTGHTQYGLQVPITQGIDTVIFQSKAEISSYDNQPCMSCGYCVRYCPEGLLPNELSKYCEYDKFDTAEKNDLFHCTECGICSYVCPAKRSMVQLLRFGKHQLTEQRAEL